MRNPKLQPGERVLADLTSPVSSVFFPFLELIAITGVLWIIIGFIDSPNNNFYDQTVRNGLVIAWMLLVVWRFLLPVWRARTRRLIVTTGRIIARAGRIGAGYHSLPLASIRTLRRQRGGLSIETYDSPGIIRIDQVARLKKVEALIASQLPRYQPQFSL